MGHDLEAEPRRAVLEHRGKPGGKMGFQAVAVADREDKGFGISQPNAAAPDRDNRQKQCQRGEQQHLPLIASRHLRTHRRHRFRRWDFSAHASYPHPGGSPPSRPRVAQTRS